MNEMILISIYIFVLAIFVGFEVITKVPPLLHTPLMSGSNAISGITIIGALLLAGQSDSPELARIMAAVAVHFMEVGISLRAGAAILFLLLTAPVGPQMPIASPG